MFLYIRDTLINTNFIKIIKKDVILSWDHTVKYQIVFYTTKNDAFFRMQYNTEQERNILFEMIMGQLNIINAEKMIP